MEYNHVLATLVVQMLVAGLVWIWWAGIYQALEEQDAGGWLGAMIGLFGIVFLGYSSLKSQGWTGFGLMVGLPVLLSIPAYWAYRAKKQVGVFIGATMAIGIALLILAVVVWYVVIPGELLGYGSLVAGALVSYLCVLLLHARQFSSDEPQRKGTGWQATIGAVLGLTIGAAVLRAAIQVLGPDFRTVLLAFLGGWLSFTILGTTIWWLLRERMGTK